MSRVAFIDVQNTETTANKLLGFVIDWRKMHAYLADKWQCEKIFFYSGIQQGNDSLIQEYEELAKLGYAMRAKPFFIYKNKDSVINIKCPNCSTGINHTIEGGVKWKSNCDVELTVDAEKYASPHTEFLIFTGDGDFEYLMRDLVEKGVKIYIASSARKSRIGPRYFTSRFSSKLRELIKEKRGKVNFIDLNDWKYRIKKDL
ncbi:MAG: NYN domain-containing protein [Candidatus Paceibacterota bacterium]|jgi:uncharacterized LabA/DUF88 family protein